MNYLNYDKIKDIKDGIIEVYCYDTGIKKLCIPSHHNDCIVNQNKCIKNHHDLFNNIYEWYISTHAIKLSIIKIKDDDLKNSDMYE